MDSFLLRKNFKKMWASLLAISISIFLLKGVVFAECTETFSWLPNTEANIVNYKIYYGQKDTGPYPNEVTVGKEVNEEGRVPGIVTGLTCGETYFFVCVAVNDAGIESSYSQQLEITAGVESEIPKEEFVVPGIPPNVTITK